MARDARRASSCHPTLDHIDDEYVFIILGRDEHLRFRAITAGLLLVAARAHLFEELRKRHARPTRISVRVMHPGSRSISLLRSCLRSDSTLRSKYCTTKSDFFRSRHHRGHDALPRRRRRDFIEQFQTTAFDTRIWELYLFAAFTELGYASASSRAVSDLTHESCRFVGN